jgi:hypothetical protein
MSEPLVQELAAVLRAHHAYADNISNHVATDERYWSDNGDTISLARRWYWQSDLKKRTEEILARCPDQSPTEAATK